MTTLRISFTWEDDGSDQAYDDLFQALMELGASDVEEERVPEPDPQPKKARKKKPQYSEGIALPTDGV